MNKNERDYQIVYYIFNKTSSFGELTNFFNISEKTLLRTLDDWKKVFNDELEIKDRKVTFKGDKASFSKKVYSKSKDFLSKWEAQMYILNYVFDNLKSTLKDLSEDLEKTNIETKSLIDELNEICFRFDFSINLTQKSGLKFSKYDFESFISVMEILINNQIYSRQKNTLIKVNDLSFIFNPYTYKFLNKKLKLENFAEFYKTIVENIKNNKVNLSDADAIFMAIKICLWKNLEKNKNTVLDNNNIVKDFYENYEIPLVTKNSLKRYFDKSELKESVEIFLDQLSKSIEFLFKGEIKLNDETIDNIRKHVIRTIEIKNAKQTGISYDFELYGLSKYIVKFNELFNICKKEIEKLNLNEKLTMMLTYEIFIHLIIWLDGIAYIYNTNIFAVCVGGMGQSAMVSQHLKKIYKNANIVAKANVLLREEDIKKAHLIISSIEIINNHDNIIFLPAMSVINNKEIVHKKLVEMIYRKLIE
ncbi:hypothetical protein [Mesoplasma photuris]|uniref:hypothetical protein n=1 Tax=Mesoplasma photuris TaxID=217731 RepID=UPI0004E1FCA0|nr:hypothetical protein [Mesoplasma photuris]